MYDVGDVYPAVFEVRDGSGNLTIASATTFTFTLPDGTATSPVTPANPTTGIYTYNFPITQAGLHRFRGVSTNPDTSSVDVFNVASAEWPAFVGLAEVKNHLNIPATTMTYDDELRAFILSACEVVESIVGPVARRTVTETHSGGTSSIWLSSSQVLSVTAVTENGVSVAPSAYALSGNRLTRRADYWDIPWAAGSGNITVTYVAGRASVPWAVLDGTKELIRLNWRPQTGGSGSVFNQGGDDSGQAGGGEIRLGFFIPNTVMQRLQPSALGPLVA